MKEDLEKDEERFLSRWSRLKQAAKEQPPARQTAQPAADPNAPPPELPPLDKLTIDSDYRGFFHPKVDENLRRNALKKLFSDPHFNVMDGLDVYIDDYSKPNPLPAAMLAQLKQAQKILEWAKDEKDKKEVNHEGVAEPALSAESVLELEERSAEPMPAAPQTVEVKAVERQPTAVPQPTGDGKV